ncbi:MAG: hypothetical protein LBG72_01245 [Spirochaetaceae bacterium]|nr:hypothetical protein [Spirochaetaceae bacterium]
MFMSCATTQYQVEKNSIKELAGQKTVFLDVIMAPRKLKVMPLIDAGIYNSIVNKAEPELSRVEKRKLSSMNSELSEMYADSYNAEVVRAVFPAGQTPALKSFSNADEYTTAQLVKLCGDNKAEFIVTTVGQIQCTDVGAFGIRAANRMNMSVCIFDKSGQLIAQGKVNTKERIAGGDDTAVYGLLFDEGATHCSTLLQRLAVSKK